MNSRFTAVSIFSRCMCSRNKNTKSIDMSVMSGWQLQCVNTTCLPVVAVTQPSILDCQLTCLTQDQCQGASFQERTSICKLFVNIQNQKWQHICWFGHCYNDRHAWNTDATRVSIFTKEINSSEHEDIALREKPCWKLSDRFCRVLTNFFLKYFQAFEDGVQIERQIWDAECIKIFHRMLILRTV